MSVGARKALPGGVSNVIHRVSHLYLFSNTCVHGGHPFRELGDRSQFHNKIPLTKYAISVVTPARCRQIATPAAAL